MYQSSMFNVRVELEIPTYSPTAPGGYDEPVVPLLVYWEDGIRMILGDRKEYSSAPDVTAQRHKTGWVVYVHPSDGDPACAVIILDDGSVKIVPDDSSSVEILKEFPDGFDYI